MSDNIRAALNDLTSGNRNAFNERIASELSAKINARIDGRKQEVVNQIFNSPEETEVEGNEEV